MDRLPRGTQVLMLERGAQVLHHPQVDLRPNQLLDRGARLPVAGVDHWDARADAQARARVGREHHLGQVDQVADRAAVGAARHQQHVRPQSPDALHLLVILAAVIHGDHVHDDRAGPECGPLRALRAHRLHHSGNRHLQPAAGGGSGEVEIRPRPVIAALAEHLAVSQKLLAGQLLDLAHRVRYADRHVVNRRLDGGRRLAPADQAVALGLPLDEDGLGGSAAAVGSEDGADRIRHGVLLSERGRGRPRQGASSQGGGLF